MPINETMEGLTQATEASNAIAKASTGLLEIIGKSLNTLVMNFLVPFFAPFMAVLMSLVGNFVQFFMSLDKLPETIMKLVDENVFKPISEWIDKYIIKPLEGGVKTIKDVIDGVFKFVGGISIEGLISGIKSGIDTAWNFVTDGVDGILKEFGKILEWFGGGYDTVKKVLGDVWDSVTKTLEDVWNGIVKFFEPFLSAIDKYIVTPFKDFIDGAYSVIKSALNTLIGSVLGVPIIGDALKALGIRQFEKGGVVPGTGPQLAIVHGGETITPANQSGNVTVNFYGYNDDKMVEKVRDILRRDGARYGA